MYSNYRDIQIDIITTNVTSLGSLLGRSLDDLHPDGLSTPGLVDDLPDVPQEVGLGGDVLVEPAVDQHVADGGAHGQQVETEE